MKLGELVETSRAVGATRKRTEKLARLAALLRRLGREDVGLGPLYLSGKLRQGKIGVGPSALDKIRAIPPAPAGQLSLQEVDRAFAELEALRGSGGNKARTERLSRLFAAATADEQAFLCSLIAGELRQGALEGLLIEALALAVGTSREQIHRAHMLSGDLESVASVALVEGAAALAGFGLRLFVPVLPMLAETADTIEDVFRRFRPALFEFKVDGARVQVHKSGPEVRVFTRRQNEVTNRVPELVAAVAAFPARSLILDGETIALGPDGAPRPFQVTQSRFARRQNVAAAQLEVPLSTYFFDCLYLEGQTLIDAPAEERNRALESAVPPALVIERARIDDEGVAEAFMTRALEQGHEGVMAKAPEAKYQAGQRGASWLKLKSAHTLDLLVLAAEWGSGRRTGWLSNLHLGARDPASGRFVMLGKTFKGLTDEMLRTQTARFLELEVGREGPVVFVRPEFVVEVAFADVQFSPHYPAGLALRFARVRAFRPDKTPAEVDTLDRVRALHRTI